MAYLFNGATHVIRRADAVVQTWPLTMFARVRLPVVDTAEHVLVAIHEATVNNGVRMVVAFTGGSMKARIGSKAAGANANATTTTSISDTNWHTVTGEVIGSTGRQVWLDNGGTVFDGNARSPGVMTKTLIGATEDSGVLSGNVGHEIADAAIWSGTLSADDRAALNAGVSPALIRPDALEIYLPGLIGAHDQRGGAFTVIGATAVPHPRVYMPAPVRIIGVPDAASGVTGTLAATEGTDSTSLVGTVLVQGSLSSTEAADSASFSGDVIVQGLLAASEAADSASIAGNVLVQGSLSASEAADTASLTGNVSVQGVIAATEGADSASFSGEGLQVVTGSLAASESSDTAALLGQVLVQGTLNASEVADILAMTNVAPVPVPERRTSYASPVVQSTADSIQTTYASPAPTRTSE